MTDDEEGYTRGLPASFVIGAVVLVVGSAVLKAVWVALGWE